MAGKCTVVNWYWWSRYDRYDGMTDTTGMLELRLKFMILREAKRVGLLC